MDEVAGKILRKYPAGKKHNLIPILQEFKKQSGGLSDEIFREISNYLNIPVNKIHGVSSFYDQFRPAGKGKPQFRVCCGTNCHLEGSGQILKQLEELQKSRTGYTGRDSRFSIETVTCFGACSNSPVISINDGLHTKITKETLIKLIDSLKEDGGKGR
ncbi:MAG: NAD(P)H-dependent oxidoreductase subunit E [Bacteroidetes bacterium]|nr:NAD(P)H-dependent oxidoreductase subunit E [Bacteroidota bacterium]